MSRRNTEFQVMSLSHPPSSAIRPRWRLVRGLKRKMIIWKQLFGALIRLQSGGRFTFLFSLKLLLVLLLLFLVGKFLDSILDGNNPIWGSLFESFEVDGLNKDG